MSQSHRRKPWRIVSIRTWINISSAAFIAALGFAGVTAKSALGADDPIAPGTKITMQNWTQFKQFMSDGMIKLFEGTYYWKMPADIEIDIGPNSNVPLPPTYLTATEQYGSQTKVVHLPDGRLNVSGYVAGLPFPDPQEPDKGYKMLVNAWYSYRPHLNVDMEALGNAVRNCTVDRFGNMACENVDLVYRQTGYNTDPGVARWESDKVWYTEYLMVEKPEQAKYTAEITLFYKDEQDFQDEYVFVPALRRSLRVSSTARCSQLLGTDFTQDDYQVSGFNGGIGQFNADYLGSRKIISLTGAFNYRAIGHNYPYELYQPLLFPKPAAGDWQVRNVDVLDVRRIPSARSGYCYGKRIMYLDTYYHTTHWQELYDANLKLWKIGQWATPDAARVPGVPGGLAPGLGGYAVVWDVQGDHMTMATSFNDNGDSYYVNGNVPKDYQNVTRYATPAGLSQIMQ